MRCPVCKIDSMRTVPSGGRRIDRCVSCGAAWFDPGEIRELTDGRFPENEPPATAENDALPGGKEEVRARMTRAWKEAAALACPRCSCALQVIDFQSTGFPVFPCRACGGMLVPRRSVTGLARWFGLARRNGALYKALGASLAQEQRRRLEREYGAGKGGDLRQVASILPVVVPLADGAPSTGRLPVVTLGLAGLMLALQLLTTFGAGGMNGLPGRLALPSGTGMQGVPKLLLWLSPFFHGGIVPLAVGCLFLLVLGDNVEDRIGSAPFLVLYLGGGAIAAAAHILWGDAGAPAALGSAGAVAAVLGAYLVFFPEVPITMYGMGEVVPVPAYLFACAWAVALFLWGWGPGPLSAWLNPAPYSLAGNLAGFAVGAGFAMLWRALEIQKDRAGPGATSGTGMDSRSAPRGGPPFRP
jgi:membrane associated rhomboid family serine protease